LLGLSGIGQAPHCRALRENGAAAALLREIDCSHLQHLVAAHLSERNNQPERVLSIAANVLAGSGVEIAVATPDFGFDWRSLV